MIDTPEEFGPYWQDVTEEASALYGSAVEVEHLPLRDNEISTAYGLRFSGIGGYPLFAVLTVPKGIGPYPALMQAPAYGSVVGVPAYERRARYVVLALCHRGQRLADSLYSAAYPGLLTDGLPGPSTYRWREIVADCVRALDVLEARPDVDGARLAVVGNDLAAITAALRPRAPYLLVNSLIFRGAAGSLSEQSAYPGRELTDYVRAYPEQADQVKQTLALFDPLAFTPQIEARTLVSCGEAQQPVVQPLVDGISGEASLKVTSGRGYLDHEYEEAWLEEQLRPDPLA